MCGIAGFVLAQPSLPRAEIESRLWAMTGTVKHRGPDDQAVWTDGLAGLAQARLAVIDLSAAANQPIASRASKSVLRMSYLLTQYTEDPFPGFPYPTIPRP